MIRPICLFVLVSLIGGCAASGPQFSTVPAVQLQENESALLVYRPSKFEGSGNYPTFRVDEGQCFELRDGGFFRFITTPGNHTITLVKETKGKPLAEPVDLEVALLSQDVVFVRYEVNLEDFFAISLAGTAVASGTFSHNFVLVDNDVGSNEIVRTRYQTEPAPCD